MPSATVKEENPLLQFYFLTGDFWRLLYSFKTYLMLQPTAFYAGNHHHDSEGNLPSAPQLLMVTVRGSQTQPYTGHWCSGGGQSDLFHPNCVSVNAGWRTQLKNNYLDCSPPFDCAHVFRKHSSFPVFINELENGPVFFSWWLIYFKFNNENAYFKRSMQQLLFPQSWLPSKLNVILFYMKTPTRQISKRIFIPGTRKPLLTYKDWPSYCKGCWKSHNKGKFSLRSPAFF